MKRWCLPLLMCLAANPLWASPMDLAFDDLPGLVAGQNRIVESAGINVQAAAARKGHLSQSFLPALRAEAGQESFKTGAYERETQPYGSVEATVNIFRSGRDALEHHTRAAQVDALSAMASRTYREELSRARKLYWYLVFTGETIQLLIEATERNRQYLASADRRVRRGLASGSDRLEFQMHGLQLKEQIKSLTHETLLIETALAPLLGLPLGTKFNPKDPLFNEHDDALLSLPLDAGGHPDVAELRAQEAATRMGGKALGKTTAPSLDLYGGWHLYNQRERDYPAREDRDDTVAGARVSWAFFDGFQTRRNALSLAQQAEAARVKADHRAITLEAAALGLREDLKHKYDLVRSSEEQIALAGKYLTWTLDEYDRGVKNSPDVLGAVRKVLDLERQYAERRRTYQNIRADLLELLGS